jgi:phosphate transport system permease protein
VTAVSDRAGRPPAGGAAGPDPDVPRIVPAGWGRLVVRRARLGDRAFRWTSGAAGALVLLVMAAIAVFLVYRAVPALRADKANVLTEQQWDPDGTPSRFGIAATLYFTLVTSAIAMILAVPLAIGSAVFITYYAPRRLREGMGYVVELLAAIPSIVYGLWGFTFLAPHLTGVVEWLNQWFGWTVILRYRPENQPNSFSPMGAGVLLAIMILPIISAISREAFQRVPPDQLEAALALGATRAEMIRMAVLPHGRSAVISASMLGLGRALGETLAITMLLSTAYHISLHITETGGVTFASVIVLKYGEAGEIGTGALIAAGLCLFLLTATVNFIANSIVGRQPAGGTR